MTYIGSRRLRAVVGGRVYAETFLGVDFDDDFDTTTPNPGATDNTNGLNSAIAVANALAASRGGAEFVFPPGGAGKISAALTPFADGLEVSGDDTQLNPYATNPGVSTTRNWMSAVGTAAAGKALTADAAEQDLHLALANVTGLARGDVVMVQTNAHATPFGTGSVVDVHLSRLFDVTGLTASLVHSMYRPATVANGAQLYKLTPRRKIALHGFGIDGGQCFGLSNMIQRAIYLEKCLDPYVDVPVENFGSAISDHDAGGAGAAPGQQTGAIFLYQCLGGLIHRPRMVNCGSRSTAAIEVDRSTRVRIVAGVLEALAGFAVVLSYGGGHDIDGLDAAGTSYGSGVGQDGGGLHYGQGRLLKLQGVNGCRVRGIDLDNAWDTALAVALNSCGNIVETVRATANGGGTLQGIGAWFDASGNMRNQITGLLARRQNPLSAPSGLLYDVQLGAHDSDNYVEGRFAAYQDNNQPPNYTAPDNVIVLLGTA